ncbi:MAG: hypothetical protein WA960_04225 [Tunicatimonas sp.]
MKSQFTSYVTIIAVLLTIVSCDNINRESKDVSTNAATLSADTLETMNLTTIDDDAALVVEDEEVVAASAGAEPTANRADDDRTYTETEVVQIDTISTRIVYDIRRRMIEEVDTVGATKTYEIRRKVLRRTVSLDTLTETNDEERTVAYQKGDYKVLDEKVETDTAVEVLDYAAAKREAAKERAKVATTPARTTQPATTTAREDAATQPTQQPAAQSTPRQSTTNASDTTSTSRLPVRPSTETPASSEQRPTRPGNNATPSDTTSTESGS